MINLEELQRILDMAASHGLHELELEVEGFKLRVRRHGASEVPIAEVGPARTAASPAVVAFPAPPSAAAPAPPSGPAVLPPGSAEPAPAAPDGSQQVVTSPIVGTFYRAPEPGASPFVEVGQKVQRGQVLCIIEAMKLMNEIESEEAGEIVAIFVENAQPVQFGEPLFAIKVR